MAGAMYVKDSQNRHPYSTPQPEVDEKLLGGDREYVTKTETQKAYRTLESLKGFREATQKLRYVKILGKWALYSTGELRQGSFWAMAGAMYVKDSQNRHPYSTSQPEVDEKLPGGDRVYVTKAEIQKAYRTLKGLESFLEAAQKLRYVKTLEKWVLYSTGG